MAVLIFAQQQDEHAVAVAAHLKVLGKEAVVLDTGLFPEAARLSMRYKCCTDHRDFHLEVQGKEIPLEAIDAVWWRRPQPHRISEQMTRSSHRLFAANEAHEALAGLWQCMDAEWINDPSKDLISQRKGYQLKIAQQVGLRIPATLITNDPESARNFADARAYRDIVYKSFSSTEQEWRETRLLRQDEIPLLDHVRHAPVIFQHYVEAQYDLRITVVGDRIFPAAIHSQQTQYKVDCRVDIATARIEAVDIPPEVQSKLLALMRALGLTYGAIDMRLRPNGEYVFLEVNPAGQFMYIEVATGQPISNAMAEALARPAGCDSRRSHTVAIAES